MSQEIIVYRNPAEATFWNTFSNHPEYFIAFFGALVVFLAIVTFIDKVMRPWLRRKLWSFNKINSLQLWVATIGGIVTLIILLEVL